MPARCRYGGLPVPAQRAQGARAGPARSSRSRASIATVSGRETPPHRRRGSRSRRVRADRVLRLLASVSPTARTRRWSTYSQGMRQAPRRRSLPARRPRAADPRRADERARPRRESRTSARWSQSSSPRIAPSFSRRICFDEIEKTCDSAAIIDGGRDPAPGADRDADRDRRVELLIGLPTDPERALELLTGDPGVLSAQRSDDGLAGRPARNRRRPGGSSRRSCRAGIGVSRLEPVRETLEQRFLEITSRLETPA